MRKLKFITAFITSLIIFAFSCTSAFAGSSISAKPFLLSSDVTDTMEAAKQLGIITDDIDKSSIVTRKELCRLIVRFYRASTGGTGITISESPFFDCDANEVIFCYEKGIIKGISDVTFAPDYFITREEACEVVVNTIEACKANKIEPEKDFTILYKDRADMSDEFRDDISYLSSIGVVNGYGGYFYPKSYITYEQAATMLVETYYQLMLSKININGVDISLGDTKEKILSDFGEPGYKIEDKNANTEIWVYEGENLFYIGFCDNNATEIFSNGSNFKYRGISSGQPIENIDFGARAKVSGNTAVYEDGYGIVQTGAFSGYNKISYVYAASENKDMRHKINPETVNGDIELLYDIINTERAKSGLPEFTVYKQAAATAKRHSMSMGYWNYSDYINRYGTTPFDRFDDSDIEYMMASENIAKVDGNAVDVYIEWMKSPGSRSNIITDYMDNVGIGIVVGSSDNKAYVTMDFLKLKQ